MKIIASKTNIMFILMILIANYVSAEYQTYTDEEKVKIEFSNGAVVYLNYTTSQQGYENYKNITYDLTENIIILNLTGTNYSLFNITSGETVFSLAPTYTLVLNDNEEYEVSEEGSCIYFIENMSINRNTTFCNKIYKGNDSNSDGAIYINKSNIHLNCNKATINGNKTGYAITTNQKKNITISNCIISNYDHGIRVNTNSFNITIINSIFTNMTTYGGIYIFGTNYTTIYNNSFYNASIYQSQGNNTNISYNYIYCDKTCGLSNTVGSAGINLAKTRDAIIQNNIIYSARNGIQIGTSSWNNIIEGNIINNTDECSLIKDSWNINYTNNYCSNSTNNADNYDVGIQLYNSSQILIQNNYFKEVATCAILLRKTFNVSIISNSIDLIPLSSRKNYLSDDVNEIPSAICIQEIYKGYLFGSNNELSWDNTFIFNSTNISIYSNSIDSDTQVYLKTIGATNIYHDLTNYLYKSFQLKNISGTYTFYINPATNTLRFYGLQNYIQGTGSILESPRISLLSANQYNYTLSKNYFRIKNINETLIGNISFFNLTKTPYLTYARVAIFNSTQSEPAVENVDEYTATLNPNNRTLVYQFETNTQPYPTYISTNITDFKYEYSTSGQKTLKITCTANSNTNAVWNMTNMNDVGSTYRHFVDGVFVESLSENSIQITSCSEHIFTVGGSIGAYSKESERVINTLIVPLTIIGIIVILLLPFINKKYEDWEEKEWINYFIKSFIIIIVGIAVVIFISNI